MKKQNTTTIWLILFIIALGLAFYLLVNRQIKGNDIVSIANQSNSISTKEDELNQTSSTNSSNSLDNSSVNQNNPSNAEAQNLAPSDSQSVIKNLTEKPFSDSKEKAAQKQIDSFYQFLATGDFNFAFSLFEPTVRIPTTESQISTKKPTLPKAYKIESIEIRSDETTLAVTSETLNNLTEKRFFELAPASGSNKIFRYFKIGDSSVYGGFDYK